jgi:hypothetical protein
MMWSLKHNPTWIQESYCQLLTLSTTFISLNFSKKINPFPTLVQWIFIFPTLLKFEVL